MRRQNKRHRKIRKYMAGPNFSGQHLLHHPKVIHALIGKAHIKPEDTVLDIGAGKGALTFPLAEKAGKVLAVEYDSTFVDILRQKAEGHTNIKIIHCDFLRFSLPKEPFGVVASIPYAITTPILKKLLNQPAHPLQRAVLVTEWGAAKRFTSNPTMNPLILKWRMWFDMQFVNKISRHCFSPPPKIHSAVIMIRRKRNPRVGMNDHLHFMGLVEYALKYPQLPIYQALKGIFTTPQMKHLCKNIDMHRDTPIGLLNEQQWGIVFQTMKEHVERYRWPKAKKHKSIH